MSLIRPESLESGRLQLAGPLYLQIATHLRDRIQSGEWNLSQPLPNEIDLSDQYGVSLGTVRKALEQLSRQKFLVRHQGRGTFVSNGAVSGSAFWIFGFTTDRSASGSEDLRVELQTVESAVATHDDARNLAVPAGAPIARIVCLAYVSNRVASVDRIDAPLPPDRHVENLIASGEFSIADILEPIARQTTDIVDRLQPKLVDTDFSETLSLDVGQPVLGVERQLFDFKGTTLLSMRRLIVPAISTMYATSVP